HDEDWHKNMVIEFLRTPESFLTLDRQHAELTEQIIRREKSHHGQHAAKHEPVVGVGLTPTGFEPTHYEQGGEDCRHQLAEIGSHRRMSAKKSRLSKPVHQMLAPFANDH